MRVLILLSLAGCQVAPNHLHALHEARLPHAISAGAGSYVLDCAGDATGNAPHVNHGYFGSTDPATELGPFFVQAWVMPRDAGSRYWLSDGYGGAHRWLIGFTQSGPGTLNHIYALTWDGSHSIGVSGATGVPPGTWAHVAVGWDGSYLRAYLNGNPDGATYFAGPRKATGLANGGGELFVCGSTHSNFDGRVAMVQIWEGYFPLAAPSLSFITRRRFSASSWDGTSATPSSFLAYYTVPSDIVADLSPVGYAGRLHPGVLFRGGGASDDRGFGYGQPYNGPQPLDGTGALPTWVIDTEAPTAQ